MVGRWPSFRKMDSRLGSCSEARSVMIPGTSPGHFGEQRKNFWIVRQIARGRSSYGLLPKSFFTP